LNPFDKSEGFIIAYTYRQPMKYSGLEKLIFIASFFWVMNWGVRVTQVGIHALG